MPRVNRLPTQLAEVGSASERLAQAAVGLIDAHRPLHRQSLRCSTVGGEAIGVRRGLQLAPARIEVGAVNSETLGQAEQFEIAVVELQVGLHRRFSKNSDRPLSG